MNQPYSSTLEPKRITFLEDDFLVLKFMGKFQNHIYKYIKHFDRSKCQASEFNHSFKVFKPGTILLVVDFIENCTFFPKEKYTFSTIIHNKCLYLYISCTNMHK